MVFIPKPPIGADAATSTAASPSYRILKSDMQEVKPGVLKGNVGNATIYVNETNDPHALDEFKPPKQ